MSITDKTSSAMMMLLFFLDFFILVLVSFSGYMFFNLIMG